MPDEFELTAQEKIDARERALELLYEAEIKGESATDVLRTLPVAPELMVCDLVHGVVEHLGPIDGHLARVSKGWDLHRMPIIDRAILRMGVYELVWAKDVPTPVVLNEAVELAKRFSTESSSKFVNGVLARLAGELRPTST